MSLKNLEFEIKWQMREMVRKEGGLALLHTENGKRLQKNLDAIKTLQALRKAA